MAVRKREIILDSTHRAPPLDRVLVATDFSPGGTQALARAARLPLRTGAELCVVHVLPDRIPAKLRADAERSAQRELEKTLRSFAKSLAALGRADVVIKPELRRGQAHVAIIRCARAMRSELIVLGRHGRRPVRDMFLGSTAARVIRTGALPVLVVSRRATRGYRRPLFAVDLEDTAHAVVAFSLRAVGPEVREVAMVHAYEVPFEGFLRPTTSSDELTELRKQHKRAAATGLAKLQSSIGELGVRWKTHVLRADPRSAILGEASRRRSDLLVLGTHGRSGVAHALLGSVAEWVLQAATCDVLVVKPAGVLFEPP